MKILPHTLDGEIAMIYDINRHYLRAYVHRHKLHPRTEPFKAVGQSKVVMLVTMLDKLIMVASCNQPTITLKNSTNGDDNCTTRR